MNKDENEQIIIIAGFNKRKLVSKPFPYVWQRIVRRTKAPPVGKFPKRNESPKQTEKIKAISSKGSFKLE